MNCAYCTAPAVQEQSRRTSLGYRVFRCSACQRTFNERTGSPFNFLEFPTDLVLLVVIWRLRYKLSLRDLAEMFLVRGLPFTHEAVREWEARFAPLIADRLRAKRRGKAGPSWYLDETYLKVKGRWCYLYRSHRSRRQLGRRAAQRETRPESGQALLEAGAGDGRPAAGAGDH